MRRPKDSVVLVTGARGSGKSSYLTEHARKFPRVLVWSPLEETDRYGRAFGVDPSTTLQEFLEQASSGSSAVYAPSIPTVETFDLFSKICWYAQDALVLVDELADVTPIGKAVGWWGAIVRKGRHRGLDVAAGAQRPAEIDKTIIGNSSEIVCFRLARLSDRQYMANEIGCDFATLNTLQPLQFIHADRLTGRLTRGKLAFA